MVFYHLPLGPLLPLGVVFFSKNIKYKISFLFWSWQRQLFGEGVDSTSGTHITKEQTYFSSIFLTTRQTNMLPTVQCHSKLSGNTDCHEFRFSIVRHVISVSNGASLHQDCSLRVFSNEDQ